jgi:hypothetical protein
MSGPKMFDEFDIKRAHAALAVGDPSVARRWLAAVGSIFAEEIDALIRAGHHDDALHRMHVYLNPKYQSVEECEQHVGEPFHFT